MKCIIEKLGNPKLSSEDIKDSCSLFFEHGAFSNSLFNAIRNYNINVNATTKVFFQEMSSEKEDYGCFLFNKNEGKYVIYDFVLSIIDERIADITYVEKSICLPIINRLVYNNTGKRVFLRIDLADGKEYLKELSEHTEVNKIDAEVAEYICKK